MAVDTHSVERMARLRHLVRKEGKDVGTAASEVGVDLMIAQLWLRLPDDLWPDSADKPTETSVVPAACVVLPLPAGALTSGLRRVLTCRIPGPAFDRLRLGERPMLEAALVALEAGLALPLPDVAPGGFRFTRRSLAVPIPVDSYSAVLRLAGEHFSDDPRDCGGWLIARGIGMSLPLPTLEELAGVVILRTPKPVAERPALPPNRWVYPPRRRPEPKKPLPADDSAPFGEELAKRRNALGISQRDLAAATGLSRGLVAEIERGRRRHVLTRQKMDETLASLERTRPVESQTVAEPISTPPAPELLLPALVEPPSLLPVVEELPSKEELYSRRDALGFTQREFAKHAGVSKQTVYMAEHGKVSVFMMLQLRSKLRDLEQEKGVAH